MNKLFVKTLSLAVVVAVTSFSAQAQKAKKKKKKKSKKIVAVVATPDTLLNNIDSVSYCIGLNMAQNIKKDFAEGNVDAIMKGYKAAMNDTGYIISPDKMQTIVTPYFQKKQEAIKAVEKAASEKIKIDGLRFLEENAKKEGVVTTESGLQYLVMKKGEGKQPVSTSSVTVHYHGTTPSGEIFDSSVDRGQPATFGLNQVIKGWTEGVALMKEGAKYKFFIPQELAYGANPRPGGAIKPYMPLVFEVELISVNE